MANRFKHVKIMVAKLNILYNQFMQVLAMEYL